MRRVIRAEDFVIAIEGDVGFKTTTTTTTSAYLFGHIRDKSQVQIFNRAEHAIFIGVVDDPSIKTLGA